MCWLAFMCGIAATIIAAMIAGYLAPPFEM